MYVFFLIICFRNCNFKCWANVLLQVLSQFMEKSDGRDKLLAAVQVAQLKLFQLTVTVYFEEY